MLKIYIYTYFLCPKCRSCHKAMMVITVRAHCNLLDIYIRVTLDKLLGSHLNEFIYTYIYIYTHIYISKGLQCALTAVTIVALWQLPHLGHGMYVYTLFVYIYIYTFFRKFKIVKFASGFIKIVKQNFTFMESQKLLGGFSQNLTGRSIYVSNSAPCKCVQIRV